MDLISMIFNVAFDQIRCYLISNRPCKIPILPKLSSPQLLLHLRELLKYFSRRDAFQYPYHMRNRTSRWKTQKYVDRIRSYVNLLNFILMTLCYFPKYFFNLLPYILPRSPFSIFGRPPNDISCRKRHEQSFESPCIFTYHILSAFDKRTFHPRPQDWVFRCDLNKSDDVLLQLGLRVAVDGKDCDREHLPRLQIQTGAGTFLFFVVHRHPSAGCVDCVSIPS